MKRAIFIILILVTAQTARADYHYASHDGSNTYPYTSWATAAHLIQNAVDAAEGGDTIYVGAGDYHERVILHADSLALIGMGMDSTRIWYDVNYMEVIVVDSTATISDMLIEHTANFVNCIYGSFRRRYMVERCHFEGGGAFFSNAGGTARNCIFNGPHSGVHNSIGSAYLEVSNCRFTNTEISPIFSNADTNIILNNIIRANNGGGDGIGLRIGQVYDYIANNLVVLWGPSHGIKASPQNEGLSIVNNTVDTLYRWQFEMLFGITVSRHNVSTSLANNTITGGEIAGIGSYGINQTIYASYNNLWGNSQDFWLDDPSSQIDTSGGIIHEYPMFMGNGEYHLQAFSPLIDAGDPAILDVDGSRSDIGCYGGPGGCSYTYLDLAPLIPDSISAYADSGIIILSWRYNYEADFNRYQIFRDTIPGFEPTIFDIIAEPDTSYYEDTDIIPGTPYYYRLTSVDNQGNISDYSEEIAVLPTSAWDIIEANLPYEPRITSAYPNPFNSNVVIVYSASNLGPQPPQVTLKVYDIQGRVVKTLVDDRIPMGTYRAVWDGTNDSGEPVASGTYIARVSQWGCPGGDFPVKITLIK